jgi:trimethylguanosine synthase
MIETTKGIPFYMLERDKQPVMPPREPDASCPFGPGLQKYWDLLSAEERKMQMDVPGLYSLTVRELAQQIATTLKGDSVFDAFCGLGGNAIAFALAGKRVVTCELDEGRLAMAKANAEQAGVSDRITLVHDDALSQLSRSSCDAIFLDPPWGGPEYSKLSKFRLGFFSPDGEDLLARALRNYPGVAFKLPGNFDFSELERFVPGDWTIQENRLNGKLLHFTAYRQ